MKTDKEKFIELIESFGFTKSKFSKNGEFLTKGKVGSWEYQIHPELPVEGESTHVILGGEGDKHCEFTFKNEKFIHHWIV